MSHQASPGARRKRQRARRAHLQSLMHEVNSNLQLQRRRGARALASGQQIQDGMRDALDDHEWLGRPLRDTWLTRLAVALKRMFASAINALS